jgi:hypothetical protein
MCDEQVLSLQTILLPIGTRVPKIILQIVDDMCVCVCIYIYIYIYPAVMGYMVSVVVLCGRKQKLIKFNINHTMHCDGNCLYIPTNAC